MNYQIYLNFKEHIEKTKIKISELFTEDFCNEITNNCIQTNSDNISTLEDNIAFNILINQKIINLFMDFEPLILDIYDYMNSQIIALIDIAFGDLQYLKFKVEQLFGDYADEQRKKVQNIYKELYDLETEIILTYNNDLLNKVNCLNKNINFSLLGKKVKRTKGEESHKNINVDEEEDSQNFLKKKINLGDDKINNDFGEAVKNTFEGKSKIINSLIKNIFNFENEMKSRYFDINEFNDRINIAYRPQDIAGFQYIEKNKLGKLNELIKEGKIQLKTANTITKKVTYMEIMLNRILDTLFLTIKKYLYNKLTDEDMINHIKNEIHLLNFDENRSLVEISCEITNKRIQYKDKLKKLKEAKNMISKLNANHNFNFIKQALTDKDS